ncbi:unnamed protein product, partial [Musa textilis]
IILDDEIITRGTVHNGLFMLDIAPHIMSVCESKRKREVENQTGKSIKTLRSDRGGKYLSIEFTQFLKDYGILSQWTPPYTPQLNGVSERRNRTLLDMVRSMMC